MIVGPFCVNGSSNAFGIESANTEAEMKGTMTRIKSNILILLMICLFWPITIPPNSGQGAEHARWGHDMANFSADLRLVKGFFMDVVNGKFAGQDAIDEKTGTFFGIQGPWYTVGYKMAVMVEKRFGRETLIHTVLDPRLLLVLYNQAATEQRTPRRKSSFHYGRRSC